jgi:FkbM family methyltransferase
LGFAEFVYTVVLRPRPLKAAANYLIRLLVPRMVQYGPAKVVLNPKDPVVSGALAFRVYERAELAFVSATLKPGQTVLDVGANVGLYSALSGKLVGPEGRVVAFEPDPESFHYLQQTIRENELENVHAVNAAASESDGSAHLFTSTSNRGDSRLYNNELSDGQVPVKTVRLDDYLQAAGITELDYIKIDVQGFEGSVLAGLQETIRQSPRLTMVAEFWPEGLRNAGTDPHQLLSQLESLGMHLYELGEDGRPEPIRDHDELIASLTGRKYTNLVGLKIPQL